MSILNRFHRQRYAQTDEGVRPAEEVQGTKEWQRKQSDILKRQTEKQRIEYEIEKLDTEIPLQKKKVELAKLRQSSEQIKRARGGGLIGLASRSLSDFAKGSPAQGMGQRALGRRPGTSTSLAPSLFGSGTRTENYDPLGGVFGGRQPGAHSQKKKKQPQYDPIKEMLGR